MEFFQYVTILKIYIFHSIKFLSLIGYIKIFLGNIIYIFVVIVKIFYSLLLRRHADKISHMFHRDLQK